MKKDKVIKIPKPNAFGNFPVWFQQKGTFVVTQVKSTFFEKVHQKVIRRGTKVKIIKCDCTLWPLEHNGYDGKYQSKTKGGNHSIKLKYGWCIAEIIK